jgi:hypothetical protein
MVEDGKKVERLPQGYEQPVEDRHHGGSELEEANAHEKNRLILTAKSQGKAVRPPGE